MNTASNSHVVGTVRNLLRVEALGLFALAVALYFHRGGSALEFALLFLVPDLSLLGYLFGSKVGAFTYNAVHSTIGPIALGAASVFGLVPAAALPVALIWAAHVGFDRTLGYGLKYATGFGHTHLGLIGKAGKAVELVSAPSSKAAT